jgi:cation transport ATPase
VAPCTALAAFLTLLPEITYFAAQCPVVKTVEVASVSVVTVSLQGMGCVACTKKIKEALSAHDSVNSVDVSLEQQEAKVATSLQLSKAESILGPELVKSVDEAGFEATLGKVTKVDDSSASPAAVEEANGNGRGFLIAIITGLLSSSCCIVQLAINALAVLNVAHVGCSGLNKSLGPWRWHFRGLSALWLACCWAMAIVRRMRRGLLTRLMLQTLLFVTLAFLPEALVYMGRTDVTSFEAVSMELLRFKVDGMGCEACQTHVQSVMSASEGVISSSVNWETGFAEIVVNKQQNFGFQQMAAQLQEDGYEVKQLKSEL